MGSATSGPHDTASVDYPDYGYKLADAVASDRAERGVALLRIGHRHRHQPRTATPVAAARSSASRCPPRLAREHNDANVIAMGARLTGEGMAIACLQAFLDTPFAGGRHQHRVDKLSAKESV